MPPHTTREDSVALRKRAKLYRNFAALRTNPESIARLRQLAAEFEAQAQALEGQQPGPDVLSVRK